MGRGHATNGEILHGLAASGWRGEEEEEVWRHGDDTMQRIGSIGSLGGGGGGWWWWFALVACQMANLGVKKAS